MFWACKDGKLSFGLEDLKPYGLSSVPDVKQVLLEKKHKAGTARPARPARLNGGSMHLCSQVLIVASDGLWDVCSEDA